MDFGLGGFDFGAGSLPSVSSLGFSVLPSTTGTGTGTKVASPTTTSWWQSLINDGLNAYNMVSRNDLASQQIKAGQQPTVLGLPGMSSVANISSSWVMIAILLVVVVLIVRN